MTDLVNPSPFKVIYLEAAGNDAASATQIPDLTSFHTIVMVVSTADAIQSKQGIRLPVLTGEIGTILEMHLIGSAHFSQDVKIYDSFGNYTNINVGDITIKKVVDDLVNYPESVIYRSFLGKWAISSGPGFSGVASIG